MKKKLIPYYDLAKASRKIANLKIVDDAFTFFYVEDKEKVTVFFDLKSKVVVMVQEDSNGNTADDDISLEGFARYIEVLTVEQGIEIQTDQLADLKTILKKKVFKALVEHATKDNDKAKTGFDIVRGDDLVHFVKCVASGNVKVE